MAIKQESRPHGRQFVKGQSGNPKGKPKGTKNRATKELIDKLSSSGMTPVEFMTAVFRDDFKPMELRLEAASRVAPVLSCDKVCPCDHTRKHSRRRRLASHIQGKRSSGGYTDSIQTTSNSGIIRSGSAAGLIAALEKMKNDRIWFLD